MPRGPLPYRVAGLSRCGAGVPVADRGRGRGRRILPDARTVQYLALNPASTTYLYGDGAESTFRSTLILVIKYSFMDQAY